MNHTEPGRVANPDKAAYLFWNDTPGTLKEEKSIGPAITLRVKAGDQIDMEAWSRFERKNDFTHDFGLVALSSLLGNVFVSTGGFEGYTLSNTISTIESSLTFGAFPDDSGEDDQPFAYLNYIIYDMNMVPQKVKRQRVPDEAGFYPNEIGTLDPAQVTFDEPVIVDEDGYIYVWVDNQSIETKVWFDDLKVTHRQNIVVQATDYGVWGDVLREQKTDESIYRFAYQGQFAEKDDETGWNHFELREYDPMIGRTLTTDPANQFHSSYTWVGNNPIIGTDPTGGKSPIFDNETGNFLGLDKNGWEGPILFMSSSQFKSIGGASGLRNIDATRLNLTSIENQSFTNLEAWSNVITFLAANNAIPDGLGLGFSGSKFAVGMGYTDEHGNNVTVGNYLGGRFSKGTGMYVDAYNQGQMTIVVNREGKLEAPIFFKGGVWDVINTTVHENDHRSIGPAVLGERQNAMMELRAIATQRAHRSWKRVSSDYASEIRNYQSTNQQRLNGGR
jgi:RHS repeat-associated protein